MLAHDDRRHPAPKLPRLVHPVAIKRYQGNHRYGSYGAGRAAQPIATGYFIWASVLNAFESGVRIEIARPPRGRPSFGNHVDGHCARGTAGLLRALSSSFLGPPA